MATFKSVSRLAICCILMVLAGCCGGLPARGVPDLPQRIVLNLSQTPATRQAVTWRTQAPATPAQAQIAVASGSSRFDESVRTLAAQTQPVVLAEGRQVYHHAVVFDGLQPDTPYAYRVGTPGRWSEWNQFRTACREPGPFQFVYFGDPQEEVRSKCARVFRAAQTKAPDADFWLFVGDLVDDGQNDAQWAELFDALGWMARSTPLILVPGNHEYPDRRHTPAAQYRLTPLWRPHFSLPPNGPATLAETVYWIDYQGVRLVMLNGNEQLVEQAQWLERLLSQGAPAWTIVTIHQPLYATGQRRDRTTRQQLFVPLFDKYKVDLVLQGHDHCYSRSRKLRNGVAVGPHESGTVYVISVSGPKSYPVHPRHGHLMAKTVTGQQLFQIVDVHPARLEYACFDATGALVDVFVLEK